LMGETLQNHTDPALAPIVRAEVKLIH